MSDWGHFSIKGVSMSEEEKRLTREVLAWDDEYNDGPEQRDEDEVVCTKEDF